MNEKLTFQDLIDLLAVKAKLSKKDSESFLREVFAIVYDKAIENESVKIKDFGTFKPILINSRESVDVNTGNKIQIPAHYRLTFTPDKILKELVNKPFASFESVLLDENSQADNFELIEEESDIEVEDEVIDLPPTITHMSEKPKLAVYKEKNIDKELEDLVKEDEVKPILTQSFTTPSFDYSYVYKDSNKTSKITFTHAISEPLKKLIEDELNEYNNKNLRRADTLPEKKEDKRQILTSYDVIDDDDLDIILNPIEAQSQSTTDDYILMDSEDNVLPPPIPIDKTILDTTPELPIINKIDLEKIKQKEYDEDDNRITIAKPKKAEISNNYQLNEYRSLAHDEIIEDTIKLSVENEDPYFANNGSDKQHIEETENFFVLAANNQELQSTENEIDYSAIYEQEEKLRKRTRIIPYVILGILFIVGICFLFWNLLTDIENSKKIPYSYSSEIAADTNINYKKKTPTVTNSFLDSDSVAKEKLKDSTALLSTETNNKEVDKKDNSDKNNLIETHSLPINEQVATKKLKKIENSNVQVQLNKAKNKLSSISKVSVDNTQQVAVKKEQPSTGKNNIPKTGKKRNALRALEKQCPKIRKKTKEEVRTTAITIIDTDGK